MDEASKVSIYEYTDYRCFLRSKFFSMKKDNPRFSYRLFNRMAGVRSSGFLKLVMDGKRNLAEEGIQKIAKGFKLSEQESAFFGTLVRFNQASDHEGKDRYFQEMTRHRKFLRAKFIDTAHYELFSHWYYVAILELVRLRSRECKDVPWLRARLRPKVEIKKVREAVRILKKLGFLVEKQGSLQRAEAMLTTPDEIRSLAAVKFHQEMSAMASRAVAEDDPGEREFSSLTVALSEEALRLAKDEIREFRRRLHSLLEQEKDEKRLVAQVNLQLFKLGESRNGTEEL